MEDMKPKYYASAHNSPQASPRGIQVQDKFAANLYDRRNKMP